MIMSAIEEFLQISSEGLLEACTKGQLLKALWNRKFLWAVAGVRSDRWAAEGAVNFAAQTQVRTWETLCHGKIHVQEQAVELN